MLAIVETCGKQYQLQEGRYVDLEYLGVEANSKVEFDKVVMIVAGDKSLVGQPYVEGAKIAGTVMLNNKNQKVLVYKQRCKKGYRKKQGHRQMFSRVMIDSISFPGKENIPQDEVNAEVKTTKKVATKKASTKKTTEKAVAKKAEVEVTEATPAEAKKTATKKTTTAKKATTAKKTTTKKAATKAENKTEE
ncbi:MAG: 50S ribosomal protein L21 [Candidatus Gastranaerophilales bacterium]|nr:50S ribosomal protein L21 [Candidatus Gastranaerophilales bacterium]